jgi:hypothetical protein
VAAIIFQFLLASLAVWRLTHLLSKEDGPFDSIYHLRRRLGQRFFGRLLDCFYCLSIWLALPVGIWLGADWKEKLLYWLALSGAACLMEQATATTNTPKPPEYFED